MFFTRLNRIPRSFSDVNPVSDIFISYFLFSVLSWNLCTGGLPPNPVTYFIIRSLQGFVKPDLMFLFPVCFLFFCKSSAGRLSAVASTAALNIHMIRHALVIAVINTFYRLTVDADRMAWMSQGAAERTPPLSLLRKAFTAGSVTVAGVLATHHDVSLATQTVLIIGTIFHNAF